MFTSPSYIIITIYNILISLCFSFILLWSSSSHSTFLIMEEISHSHTHHFGFFFLLISTIILINVSSFGFSKPCFPNPSYSPALFVFGSSIFDVGNNNYINTTTSNQANFLPYGDTFFKYPNGRFSDGRLIPDFIGNLAIHLINL